MSYKIYPENILHDNESVLYYIEYHDWEDGSPIIWKLYKRNFIFTKEEWEARFKEMPNGLNKLLLVREGHPYSLLEDKLLPDGCIPNQKWLEFMVDALNEKEYNDNIKSVNCSGGV